MTKLFRHTNASLVPRLGAAVLCSLFISLASEADGVRGEVGRHPLPDSRAYEQVSPVAKNESDVFAAGAVADLDGSGLVFQSPGSFAGQPSALAFGTDYLARRGSQGWSTRGIGMPGGRLHFQNGYQAFSTDLTRGVIRWQEDIGTYDPQAVRGMNMYLHDNEASSAQLLNGTLDEVDNSGRFGWATPDFGKIAFQSPNKLTPDSPCNGPGVACAYEWDHGALRLASVLPNGAPTTGIVGADADRGAVEGAVSDDGRRVFFGNPGSFEPMNLYVREDASQSSLVSSSERTLPGGTTGQKTFFQGAEAAHGDRVIFTTGNALVDEDGDETNDLYLYDFSRPAGERLTLITEDANPEAPAGAAVDPSSLSGAPPAGGVLAHSHSLERIYFVTKNQILPGEPVDPGPKLYLWDTTGGPAQIDFIATLDPEDWKAWQGPAVNEIDGGKYSRISENGRYVIFISRAALAPEDSGDEPDIYRYDAETGSLVCASCSGDTTHPNGSLTFERWEYLQHVMNHQLRNVSDDGQVFFETSRGLVPADSNGKGDVYEYAEGQLHLISRGSGLYDSNFLDASASGNDIFFRTRDQLVGWDRDQKYDVYDARVGGGLPEPPPLPPPCEGDACQPPPVVPNDPTPATASVVGPGNIVPASNRKCRKGRVRRHGKCVKKPRSKKARKGAHRG